MRKPAYIDADKGSVTAQISFPEDLDKRESRRKMVMMGHYPFTYNGVGDTDPTSPCHAVKDFFTGRVAAIEF